MKNNSFLLVLALLMMFPLFEGCELSYLTDNVDFSSASKRYPRNVFRDRQQESVINKETQEGEKGEEENNNEEKRDTLIFVTAFEYPEGYDWINDPLYKNADCNLVFLINNNKVMSEPIRGSKNFSLDPDCARIINGELYTDNFYSGKTIISKNGHTLFSFDGEELICSYLIKDEDIYTLGKNKSGPGFYYRKNGELILKSEDGEIIGDIYPGNIEGALYQSNGDIYFNYFKKIGNAQALSYKKWFVAENGVEIPLDKISQDKEVLAMRTNEGNLEYVFLQKDYDNKIRIILTDEKLLHKVLIDEYNFNVEYCHFSIMDKYRSIHLRTRDNGGALSFHYLSDISPRMSLCSEQVFSCPRIHSGLNNSLWENDSALCFRNVDKSYSVCYVNSIKKATIDSHWNILSGSCMYQLDEQLYIALNPKRPGESPVIWRNGKTKKINLKNGFVSSISVVIR